MSEPVKFPFISYMGGKFYMKKHILPFPYHTWYIEVFGGSAVILLNKLKSRFEIYNDINNELVNFWEIIRTQRHQFTDTAKHRLYSRTLFDKYKQEKIKNRLERAFRFFYLNQCSFASKMTQFGMTSFGQKRDRVTRYINKLTEGKIEKVWQRIKNVEFECRDFKELLNRPIDHEEVLLYIDPPYYMAHEQYGEMKGGFKINKEEHETMMNDLLKILKELKKAKFVLSIDKKDIFDRPKWFVDEIERLNIISMRKGRDTRVKSTEYVIRNFDKERVPIMTRKRPKNLVNYLQSIKK